MKSSVIDLGYLRFLQKNVQGNKAEGYGQLFVSRRQTIFFRDIFPGK
jgi:hypothetical protein